MQNLTKEKSRLYLCYFEDTQLLRDGSSKKNPGICDDHHLSSYKDLANQVDSITFKEIVQYGGRQKQTCSLLNVDKKMFAKEEKTSREKKKKKKEKEDDEEDERPLQAKQKKKPNMCSKLGSIIFLICWILYMAFTVPEKENLISSLFKYITSVDREVSNRTFKSNSDSTAAYLNEYRGTLDYTVSPFTTTTQTKGKLLKTRQLLQIDYFCLEEYLRDPHAADFCSRKIPVMLSEEVLSGKRDKDGFIADKVRSYLRENRLTREEESRLCVISNTPNLQTSEQELEEIIKQ